MAAITLATVLASFARLSPEDQASARLALAIPAATPREQSEASAHFLAADLACPVSGAECTRKDGTVRTFRTKNGIAEHVKNLHSKA